MLDLATAKAFLRIKSDDEDGVITMMLNSAIAQVETMTGQLLTARDVVEAVSSRRMAERGGIRLFKGPVNAVDGIDYLDGPDPELDVVTVGEWQLVEGTDARLLPAWGAAWPSLAPGQTLRVSYNAGYGPDEVPPALEEAVMKLVGHAFVHRGDDNARAPDLDALIGAYRPLGIA